MYKVQQLAEIAGVSVRTLHHYDRIGLLVPSVRTEAGYRLYDEGGVLRLQQIMFFRELDVPLKEIIAILDEPGFDIVSALIYHRKMLEQKLTRTSRLLRTIETTIQKLSEEKAMENNEELFDGFSKEQQKKYEQEARNTWGSKEVDESKQRTKSWTKEKWSSVKQESEDISAELASMMEQDPAGGNVQKVIERHFNWVGQFYIVTPEVYRGLGELYTTDPRFRANYDKHKPGLADFMKTAMEYYCDTALK